jgi:putative ABC transport system permease protein
VTAGLIVRSFVQLSGADWGFDPDKLLLIDVKVPPEMKKQRDIADEWAETVVARLRALDGVEHASRSDNAPIRWGAWKSVPLSVDGEMVTKRSWPSAWVVGNDYFVTTGVPILEGREFGADDTASAPSRVVISLALARKLWPNQRAVGKRLDVLMVRTVNGEPLPEILARMKRRDRTMENDPSVFEPVEGKTWEVIGVVGDVRMFSLDIAPMPALYLDHRQNPRSRMWGMDMSGFEVKFLMRTTDKPTAVAGRAKTAILSVNPRVTFKEIVAMQDVVSTKIGGRGTNKLMVLVSTVFGGLALSFAVIGIYGVVSHTITQRIREIGIRIALGAGRGDVVRLVLRYAGRLLVAGLALGLVAAWAVTRGLQPQLFGMTATDPATYVSAVVALSFAVLAACILPLRRALRFDPVVLFRA